MQSYKQNPTATKDNPSNNNLLTNSQKSAEEGASWQGSMTFEEEGTFNSINDTTLEEPNQSTNKVNHSLDDQKTSSNNLGSLNTDKVNTSM